jgi:hypothetical protein
MILRSPAIRWVRPRSEAEGEAEGDADGDAAGVEVVEDMGVFSSG